MCISGYVLPLLVFLLSSFSQMTACTHRENERDREKHRVRLKVKHDSVVIAAV